MSTANKSKNIVILGAGFGGIRAARSLTEKLHNTPYRVVLIDKNSYHTYTSALYEVATAYRGGKFRSSEEEKAFEADLVNAASFPVKDVIDRNKVTFIQDEVVNINTSAKTIETKSEDAINYEYCIIALGSEGWHSPTKGAEECCGTLGNIYDALEIRRAIESLARKHFIDDKELQLVTVGAGFTGFELTTEMAKYLNHLAKAAYDFDRNKIHIKLIEAKDNILPEASSSERRIARRRLKKLGIDVITGKKITEVEPHQVTLSGGDTIPANFVLWGGGVKGNSLFKKIKNLPLHDSGRIKTDAHLRAGDFRDVFAIGDSAYFFDEQRKEAVPATAWAAEYQADVAAENVYRALQDRPLVDFRPKYPGFIAAAGGKYGIARLYGFTISGFLAWAVKRIVDLKYILSLYSVREGVVLWLKSVRIFGRND